MVRDIGLQHSRRMRTLPEQGRLVSRQVGKFSDRLDPCAAGIWTMETIWPDLCAARPRVQMLAVRALQDHSRLQAWKSCLPTGRAAGVRLMEKEGRSSVGPGRLPQHLHGLQGTRFLQCVLSLLPHSSSPAQLSCKVRKSWNPFLALPHARNYRRKRPVCR